MASPPDDGRGATSRERLLVLLRRRGESRIADLAAELGLTAMTIRHHLRRLEAEGLIAVREEGNRQAPGRPALLYCLTTSGDEALPKRYDRLARLLLDELLWANESAEGAAGREGLPLRLAERATAPYRHHLGELSGQDRVQAAAAILHEESGFAELKNGPGAVEIIEPNCIYRALLRPGDDSVCEFHTQYVRRLIGRPVTLAASQHHGADLCCFRVDEHE